VRINGKVYYLWRAVDHEGEVLEVYVTKRRNRKAALRFLRKAMKRYGRPETVPWRAQLEAVVNRRRAPVAEPTDYYAILVPHAAKVDIWETEYVHVLEGEDPVVEWTMGTGLRPYLGALDEAARPAFLADYRLRIAKAYPRRGDGITLFPFRRLFIVAKR
jgi:trans-aconitate methyltransferase